MMHDGGNIRTGMALGPPGRWHTHDTYIEYQTKS